MSVFLSAIRSPRVAASSCARTRLRCSGIPFVKRLLSPSISMARAYNSGRRPQWPSTVREVVENIEPVNGKAMGYPTPTVGGPGAPSCYRVSLLSGSLEVTARLKSADDLELLVKVLEANKPLFAKADRLATEVLTLTRRVDRLCTIAVLGLRRSRSAAIVSLLRPSAIRPLSLSCDKVMGHKTIDRHNRDFVLEKTSLKIRRKTVIEVRQTKIDEQIRVSGRGSRRPDCGHGTDLAFLRRLWQAARSAAAHPRAAKANQRSEAGRPSPQSREREGARVGLDCLGAAGGQSPF